MTNKEPDMRAYKQLVNGEYVVPNLKCYRNLVLVWVVFTVNRDKQGLSGT